MPRPQREISEGRKTAYYIGSGMALIGLLTFLSVFVTTALNFGDFTNFDSDMRSTSLRAVIGMGLLISGAAVRSVGARGLAGSGVVLDPERARREVEPWARMGGGMLGDALDEADIDLGQKRSSGSGSAEKAEDFEEHLRKLHRLHEDGILSREEYEQEKREVLDRT